MNEEKCQCKGKLVDIIETSNDFLQKLIYVFKGLIIFSVKLTTNANVIKLKWISGLLLNTSLAIAKHSVITISIIGLIK